MDELKLEVVTPDKIVVSETVTVAICPGAVGEFAVLKNHVSMLAALKIGVLRYRTESGEERSVFVNTGFVDVHSNLCTVLVSSAEVADDIDAARALAAKNRAEQRLADSAGNVDHARAQAALSRAMVRLSIAGKAQ